MRKIIAAILIVIILMNLTSCQSYVYVSNKQDYESFQNKKHVYVMDLVTNKDSTVYFSFSFPGTLSNNEVKGPKLVLLSDFKPDAFLFKTYKKISFAFKNDIKYKVIYRNDSIWVLTSGTTRIPFSEIKNMHIKKIDRGKTFALIFTSAGVLAGVLALMIYLFFQMSLVPGP